MRYARGGELSASLIAHDAALTRFANNAIHQNVAEVDATLTLRAFVGRRVGTASTNDLTDAALERAVERAMAHARRQPEDPDCLGPPEPRPCQPALAYDEATAGFSAEARARGVATICGLASAHGLAAAGAFRTIAREVAIATSRGLFAYHPATIADLQLVVAGADGSGWAQGSGWRVAAIDVEALGREAVAKAARAQRPRRIEPGEYAIVVDPYVTDELLSTLSGFGMGAHTVQQGRSWMSQRIGERCMSRLVSIWDDARDPLGAPQPFDGEGTPCRRVQIVERGTICGPVYDRATAARAGRDSTGHAAMADDTFADGPVASHLFMAGGESSLERMIASTERGLYITRFWYPRLVHPRDCVITAMTRDGVFLIERGELAYPVKNLRFTQSYLKALEQVVAVGDAPRTLIGDFGGVARVPALKIAAFTFHGTTV
jgi:predicted Zn-dependent protease